jgi:hypothetical protein
MHDEESDTITKHMIGISLCLYDGTNDVHDDDLHDKYANDSDDVCTGCDV